jgi:hypothetical protein
VNQKWNHVAADYYLVHLGKRRKKNIYLNKNTKTDYTLVNGTRGAFTGAWNTPIASATFTRIEGMQELSIFYATIYL